MNLPSKNSIASSIFALVGAAILGGAVYAYSYLSERDKSAEDLVQSASNFVNNKRQLAIEEIRVNLAQARSALQTETDKLDSMKAIVENDRQLRESIAGARAQAKIEAKRAALEDTLKQWREELKAVPPGDTAAREILKNKYQEVINAHFAELDEAINSADSRLTSSEITLANNSMGETLNTVDDYINDLSNPPLTSNDNLPSFGGEQTNNGVSGNTNTSTDNGNLDGNVGNNDGNTGNDGNASGGVDNPPQYPPTPPIVVTEDNIQVQQDIVDQVQEQIDNLQDQLSDTANGSADGDVQPTIDSTLDLPPLSPPQPRELNPDKPKLLQGSDL